MNREVASSSFWIDSAPLPSFSRLERDEDVDVVIVGAGNTGLTAAYLLSKAGKSVAVLERDDIVEHDTAHTSAHLTMVTDQRLSELVDRWGRDYAQAVWDAGLVALAQIDTIVRDERIACGFDWVPGYLHGPLGSGKASDNREALQREAELAADLGFEARYVDDVPYIGGPGVIFDDQARIHPRRYLAGVARAVQASGGRIYTRSAAEAFGREPLSVTANGHTIFCRDVILATYTPLIGISRVMGATLLQTKLAMYSTYVVAGLAPAALVPDGLFWDTDTPYHYLRLEPASREGDRDLVIFGGADHKTGQAKDTNGCYRQLEEQLRALVPGIELTHRWSGQVIETPDGLPYIGETARHQFAATGFGGNGLTFGTIAAVMATDKILGRENPWDELFAVSRKSLAAGAWRFVRENKDYPYYLIRDRVVGGSDQSSPRSLKRGEGRIIEENGDLVAISRAEDGSLKRVSAICTHMSCLVDWNEAERTWDCPCHGSRFTPEGAVIGGPAESPLPTFPPAASPAKRSA
jgi:glycine/D-amino acid oxidase-like deaminating enzyme/nitrite reductase/ring-hydroxylating ferredoxin subunit